MRESSLKSMLPPGMEGKEDTGAYEGGRDHMSQLHPVTSRLSELDLADDQEATSWVDLDKSAIRAVTPETTGGSDADDGPRTPARSVGHDARISQTSPRSIPGGEKPRERRLGLVFEDVFTPDNSLPSEPLGSPRSAREHSAISTQSLPTRSKTRTLDDEPRVPRQASTKSSRSHQRIGSIHSAGSSVHLEDDAPLHSDLHQSLGFPSIASTTSSRGTSFQHTSSVKDKGSNGRRLLKKSNSRSSSPLLPPPSVDSLPVPVATTDANKILRLMKTLGGRMRGVMEYQTAPHGLWASGLCYLDERGILMCEGDDQGPFHHHIGGDLRGCRVRPTIDSNRNTKCLEVNYLSGSSVRLLPTPSDFDTWLAALLSWQQTWPGKLKMHPADTVGAKTDSLSRSPSEALQKEATIIKVGKLLLWDRNAPQPGQSTDRRTSSREPRPTFRSWRRVSCTLQDNGEFKLLAENDVTVVSVIQLSQLSRCAIQQLDRSVLNEDFCIVIFPQYTAAATAISIIKPVYISLESRVLFEVWFVLLRAFAVPEIYGPQPSTPEDDLEKTDSSDAYSASQDMFRIEKSLSVRIIEAKIKPKLSKPEFSTTNKSSNRLERDSAIADYFAEIILDGEIRARTMTKTETAKPFWREDCEFSDLPAALPELSIVLKKITQTSESAPVRSVAHNIRSDIGNEIICGVVNIRLDRLERGKDVEAWFPILNSKRDTIGEMFLRIRHDEIVVLLSKDYQDISDILHRFTNGLTLQIARTLPSNLRYLAETLINIFQVSGHSASWLMTLVEDEIDGLAKETPVTRLRFSRRVGSNDSFDSVSEREQTVRDMNKSLTGEANLLFRGNSLLTQSLDYHMRRVGREYLQEVLSEKIRQINALNPDCEVDPSRLSHGDDVSKNWLQLNALTISIWESIYESAPRCPPELRQILKYIRAVADDRYGAFLRTVPYTSVSGFLFLRFFCPALLNPKLFGILRDHPRPKAQRTLTLIAKSLQVLANLTTFGQKESWMEPMNRFLASRRGAIKEFIDEICSIPADRATMIVPASYSTPLTILGRLPPISREGFPSLPYLIDLSRNYAILVNIWLDGTEGFTPSEFQGDLRKFHESCVDLRRRTEDCVAKAEMLSDPTSLDHLSLQWEDLIENVDSTSLASSFLRLAPAESMIDPENTVPTSAASYAQSSSPMSSAHDLAGSSSLPGSAGSETGSKERRERQSFWETFGKDSKRAILDSDDISAARSSPPDRAISRNGKKSFLSGLRKKGDKDDKKERDRAERERYFSETWEREKDGRVGSSGKGSDRTRSAEGSQERRPASAWNPTNMI